MKKRLGDIVLLNRLTGKFEPAEIFEGFDESNQRDFDALWKPELKRRRAEFSTWNESAKANVQDAHWKWVEKATQASSVETFVVECEGITQAMMLVDVATRFATLPPHQGRELAYIELIASAPWNRPKFSANPKYKGAGRALLATSISLSVSLEFRGRVGLHSLQQSETWYAAAGLTDCGYDEDKRMRYFEMTEVQAADFLKSGED
jgi:hypothetical protein